MTDKITDLWKHHRWLLTGVAVIVLASASFAAVRFTNPTPKIPTAEVKRGEFVDYVQLRGEAKAGKSVNIAAPFDAGDLQIIKLAKSGAQVKKGDILVQFDTTKLNQDLAQNRSALKSGEAEIEQTRAQAKLKEEQDVTDVMKARYDAEAAKLDASKQEILSKIDGEEAKLKVADAEQKLHEAEEKLKSDRSAAAADIESKKQKRDKALFEVHKAEHSVSVMTLKAPIDGVVTLERNWRAGWMGGGADFKEGDRAWPGAPIVELPDVSTIRVDARVDETERGRMKPGQTVIVRVDAVPDRDFTGRVSKISELATADFSGGWPFPKNFTVEIGIDQPDPRLRPGMTATARAAVDRRPEAIMIPVEASFRKAGRTVAYVLKGSKFEERPIEVGRPSQGQLLVASGLVPGEKVALRDPTESSKQ